MKRRLAICIASVVLFLGGLVVVQAGAATKTVSASGGSVTFTTAVKNAKTCGWSSSPKIAGFTATVQCKTGTVTRSARFKANTSTTAKSYTITLTVRGTSSGAQTVHWKVIQAGKKPPTTTTTVPPTTTTTPPLVITSFSQSLAVPLTTLSLDVTGLVGTANILVTFSNTTGLNANDMPISDTNGVLSVAVPMYLDSTTGQPAATSVSVVVSQAGRHSAARSLNLTTPPTDSSMGLQVGQISHDFLIFDSLLLSQKLNRLEVQQALQGVDNSQQISDISGLLTHVLEARNDVDRIMIDPTTIIGATNYPDGSPIQFDVNTVAMMDTVFASYLQQTMPLQAATLIRVDHARAAHDVPIALANAITTVGGLTDTAYGVSTSTGAGETTIALVQGAAGMCSTWCPDAASFGSTVVTGIKASAGVFGALLSANVAVMTYNDLLTSQDTLKFDTQHAASQSTLDADAAKIADHLSKFHTSLYQLGCAVTGIVVAPEAAALAGAACAVIVDAFKSYNLLPFVDTPASAALAQDASSNLAVGFQGGTDPDIAATYASLNPSSNTSNVALISGTLNINNAQGIASAPISAGICCFSADQIGIETLADSSGAFELEMPIGAPSTSYDSLTYSAFDFVTTSVLDSATVNLSSATLSSVISLPVLSGVCNDTDALSPDGDDPDCD
jgi:hypothetical protein